MASQAFIQKFNELLRDPANLAELKTRFGAAATGGGGVTTKAIDEKFFRRNETYAGVIET